MQPRAFTREFTRGLARTLISQVYISEAFDPDTTSPPPSKEYIAIWDTGATNTVISQKIINDLGLKSIGVAKVRTPKGEYLTNVYYACVVLHGSNVGFPHLRVTQGDIGGDADVLIGMDIICQGDFAVSNKDGKTVFSFRTPSLEHINFLEHKSSAPQTGASKTYPKVGRNAPCPCGSGKKYKKCCGK